MGEYIFCHENDRKLHYADCELKCRRVYYCEDYVNWETEQYYEAKAEADEKRKKLEEENGVIRTQPE